MPNEKAETWTENSENTYDTKPIADWTKPKKSRTAVRRQKQRKKEYVAGKRGSTRN